MGRQVRWSAIAVGDSNIFILDRSGRLLRSFPISRAEAFGGRPNVIRSRPPNIGPKGARIRTHGVLSLGGMIILASDAVAAWLRGRCRLDPTYFPDSCQRSERDQGGPAWSSASGARIDG